MPEGIMIRTAENKSRLSSLTALNEVMREGKIIESYAFMCDSEHNLYVKLGDITGIIPKKRRGYRNKRRLCARYCRYITSKSPCVLCHHRYL